MPDQPPRLTLDRAAGVTWRVLLIAFGGWVLAWALAKVLVVVIPLVVGLFLTAILQPAVNELEERGLKRILGTFLVLFSAIGIVVGTIWLLAPSIADQFTELGPTLQEARRTVENWLVDGPIDLSRDEIDGYYQRALDQLGAQSSQIAERAVQGATLVAEFVAGILLTLVITFFLMKDGPLIAGFFLRQVPARREELARSIGSRVWSAISGFIRGTALIGVIEAVSTGIGLWIVGVPLVLPIALLFFVGAFFPLVGAVVAGIVATLVALVAGGVVKALIVFGIVLFVQQVESDLLQPVVMSKAINLHPLVILVVLSAGAVIGGIVGAFVAVPTTAVVVAVGTELKEHGVIGPDQPAGTDAA
jgi:predicted PurR-regulated permease PerM